MMKAVKMATKKAATKSSGGAAKKATQSSAKKSVKSGTKTAAKTSAKKATKKAAKKSVSGKRTLIDTGTDKRYVRRDAKGQFKDVVDVGRSLSQDRRRKAKTKAPSGQGDKGD
jgi:uncharacterized protein YdeI (BOF family)